mmetsp:Transcript_19890/g.44319  ORF Transcript_19890/g.44319 Transcript_19890/m.44319 type:complete len:114 (+) Transcript_19890:2-343(+)
MPVKPGCFAVRWAQNLSPNQSNVSGVQLRKPHDAWPQDVSLPLAFDCCGMKVSCPPQQADQGPGCLSSQGVLQSDGLKISAQIKATFRGCNSANRMMHGHRTSHSHLHLIVVA